MDEYYKRAARLVDEFVSGQAAETGKKYHIVLDELRHERPEIFRVLERLSRRPLPVRLPSKPSK